MAYPDSNNDITLCSMEVTCDEDGTDSPPDYPPGEEQVDTTFQDLTSGPTPPNIYVGKRNFIHQLMDVALLMANVSQLKALLYAESNEYFYLLLTFICVSISLQVLFTICMLAIWSLEKDLEATTGSDKMNAANTQPDPANTVNAQSGTVNRGYIGNSNNNISGISSHDGNDSGNRRNISGVIGTQVLAEMTSTQLRSEQERKRRWAERLDKLGNILVLFIIVSNVFITGFGVEGKPLENGGNEETIVRLDNSTLVISQ